MKDKKKLLKRIVSFIIFILLTFNTFAALVKDNNGAVFISKPEFDTMRSNFQAQLNEFNKSIDSKIDTAIASYLAGIVTKVEMPISSYDFVKSLYWQNELTSAMDSWDNEKIIGKGYYIKGCAGADFKLICCYNSVGYATEIYRYEDSAIAGLYADNEKLIPFCGFAGDTLNPDCSSTNNKSWYNLASTTFRVVKPSSGLWTGFVNEFDTVPTLAGAGIVRASFVHPLYGGYKPGQTLIMGSNMMSAYTGTFTTYYPDFLSAVEYMGLSYSYLCTANGERAGSETSFSGNWNTCKYGILGLNNNVYILKGSGDINTRVNANQWQLTFPKEMGGIKYYKNIDNDPLKALDLRNVMLSKKYDDYLYAFGGETLDYGGGLVPIPTNSGIDMDVVTSKGTIYDETPETTYLNMEGMPNRTFLTSFINQVQNQVVKIDGKGYYDYKISDYYNKLLYDNGFQLKLWEGAPIYKIPKTGEAKISITIGGGNTGGAKLSLSNKKFDSTTSGTSFKVRESKNGVEKVAYNLPINSGSNKFEYYCNVEEDDIIYFRLSPSVDTSPNNVINAEGIVEVK